MLSNRTLTCFLAISDGVVFRNFVGSSSAFDRFEASQKFSAYYVIKNFTTALPPATSTFHESDQFRPCRIQILEDALYVIFPPTPRSPK